MQIEVNGTSQRSLARIAECTEGGRRASEVIEAALQLAADIAEKTQLDGDPNLMLIGSDGGSNRITIPEILT